MNFIYQHFFQTIYEEFLTIKMKEVFEWKRKVLDVQKILGVRRSYDLEGQLLGK